MRLGSKGFLPVVAVLVFVGATASPSFGARSAGTDQREPKGFVTNANRATAVDHNADGRLEAVWLQSGNVFHQYQLWPNGPWSAASPLTTPAPAGASEPLVELNGVGRLEAFVDAPGGTWNAWQLAPNSAWSPWTFTF